MPAVVLASVWLDLPLMLGLHPRDLAMLSATLLACAIALGSGHTHMKQCAVHRVMFAGFLFLARQPQPARGRGPIQAAKK